jgi:hypothetical protein
MNGTNDLLFFSRSKMFCDELRRDVGTVTPIGWTSFAEKPQFFPYFSFHLYSGIKFSSSA